MYRSARRITRQCAALVVAVVAAGLVAPVAPVAATGVSFQVTYPVTYEYVNGVPTGTHLAIFTDSLVSAESFRPFDPWRTTAPDGLEVWASCGSYAALRRLPITFVGQYGERPEDKKTQINVYAPNEPGPDPWGGCPTSVPRGSRSTRPRVTAR